MTDSAAANFGRPIEAQEPVAGASQEQCMTSDAVARAQCSGGVSASRARGSPSVLRDFYAEKWPIDLAGSRGK